MSQESIIVPMNPHPKGPYYGGSTPGSIIAQQWFQRERGKVIISFDKPCRYSNKTQRPCFGFFYDVRERKVTHKFSVVDIISDMHIVKYLDEEIDDWNMKYLPPWRTELLEESRSRPDKNQTWMLLTNIFKLDEQKDLDYFEKRACRSFIYSLKGPELTTSEKKADPDDFIDSTIFNNMRSGLVFTEDQLELLIWALLVKNKAEYVERQRTITEGPQRLRMDLLTKIDGEYVVMELKRDTATMDDLTKQLRLYMDKCEKRLQTKVRGVLVAKYADNDLKEHLAKDESNVSFWPYTFSIECPQKNKIIFKKTNGKVESTDITNL